LAGRLVGRVEHIYSGVWVQPFPCSYATCGQSFSTDISRKRHIKTVHQQIKEFPCPICGHSVRDSFNLNAHLKSHGTTLDQLTPEALVTCRLCNLRFQTPQEREEHMEEHRRETKTQGWAKLKASFVEKRRKTCTEEYVETGKRLVKCTLCEANVDADCFAGHLAIHTSSVKKTSEVFMQSVAKFLQTLSDACDSRSFK